MKYLRQLYAWYRPLHIEWTILAIEKKHMGPCLLLLSFEVNYGGYKKFSFTGFCIFFLWGSHFAVSLLGLNYRIIKMGISNWQSYIKFFKWEKKIGEKTT